MFVNKDLTANIDLGLGQGVGGARCRYIRSCTGTIYINAFQL